MRFTLIKVKPGGNTTLKWETENTVDRNDSLETKVVTDEAQPALEEALEALRPDICKLLDSLPKGWAASLEIRTLSFRWKDNRYAVVVSMVRELGTNNKPLNISTPQFSQGVDDESEGGAGIIPGALGKKIQHIFELANELRQDIGTRLDPQLSLEIGGGDPAEEAEETDAETEEEPMYSAPARSPTTRTRTRGGAEEETDEAEQPTAQVVEIFRDGERRKVEAGKTLVVVGSNGLHSGDHLRVLEIGEAGKHASVALWNDEDRAPIGVVAMNDLGWSQQHHGFLAVHIDWAEAGEEEPGPFDDVAAEEEQEEATIAS